ncbi:DUF1186 domain-containing protein [Saccharicrinis aurantiacus]|uniref:DUF1186 domain-containing protein n=1 Tax=Saccharicrinis aurantiacus TaxID=1849719 RepID=UPI0024933EF2|nr:DUF1186 domain-containing protein [Saccharicrinis aurantiacus]
MSSSSQKLIKVTNDSTILDTLYSITEPVRIQLQKAYDMALNGKAADVVKMQQLINKYPHVPHFKNYLTALYKGIGQMEKSYDLTLQITLQHPAYLFGKLNLANKLLDEGKFNLIPEVLGSEMELAALYPERDTFHIDELTKYYHLAARYYLKINQAEEAEACYNYLKDLAPDDEDTKQVLNMLTTHKMLAGMHRLSEEGKHNIEVHVKAEAETSKVTKAPTFVHKEIDMLYQYDMRIEKDILQEILTLPRQTLIADLELVLNDSIARFNYFDALYSADKVEANTYFPLHALYLLGELNAAESTAVVFKMLSQHQDYYDLYFGDWIHDNVWEPIYRMNNTHLEEYKAFMLEPNKYTYAKNVLIILFEQIVVHQPQRKQEIVDCYKELLEAYNKCSIEDNIIDSELIAYIACSVCDMAGTEASEQLKPLFDKNWVAQGICGSYSDIMKAKPNSIRELDLLNIEDRYTEIGKWFAKRESDAEFTPEALSDANFNPFGALIKPVTNETKIGRNDPCSCGSGKKYKKCCINK